MPPYRTLRESQRKAADARRNRKLPYAYGLPCFHAWTSLPSVSEAAVRGRPVGGTLTPIGIHRRGGLRPFWYGSPTLCTTQRSGAASAPPAGHRQEREHLSRVAPGEMPVESATRVRYWERNPHYRPLRAQLEPSPITTYFMSRYLYTWGIEDCFYRSSRKYSGDRLEAGRLYHPPPDSLHAMTGDMHIIANRSAHVMAS